MIGFARRHVGLICLAILVVTPCLGGRLEAASAEDGGQGPLDLVQSSIARVQAIARSEASGRSTAGADGIRRTAETLFDFDAMSRRMLAQHWSGGSPAQQVEFVRLLTDLLERTYMDVIARGARGSITFEGQSSDGVYARVKSRVVPEGGVESAIEYRLLKRGDRWAVYDVVHDRVSLVGNYRSQFNSILSTTSFARLLERMARSDTQARASAEASQDVGVRLILFAAVAQLRGTR
jgi:phospholipid transport system substrate-binding protein